VADRRASAFFFILVVLAVVAAGWLLYRGSGAEPQAPGAKPGPTLVPPPPPPGGKPPAAVKGRIGPRPRTTPPAPIDPVPATREGCIEFLTKQASPASPAKGGRIYPEVRMDALDALVAVEGAAADPLVLQALGGDGDPASWDDERLHAAEIRIRAGQADGAEAVRAFLKSGEDLTTCGGMAARAASWMAAADGAGVVRRLLSEKIEDYDQDNLMGVLQAAAVLGEGSSADELRRILDANGGKGDAGDLMPEYEVGGAAAGALARIGDEAGRKLPPDIESMDAEDFAKGLGARGNDAAVPLLEVLLRSEEADTRSAAAMALGAVGGAKAQAALRTALKDADEDVRAAAAVSLALQGGKDDLPAVRKGMDSRDRDVAIAAWKALALLGDADSREPAAKLLTGGSADPGPDRGLALLKRVWAAALIVKLSR
jgi:HEAT repeat protein